MLSPQDAGDAAIDAQFAKAMALTGAEFLEAVEYISNVRLFLESYFPAQQQLRACSCSATAACRAFVASRWRLGNFVCLWCCTTLSSCQYSFLQRWLPAWSLVKDALAKPEIRTHLIATDVHLTRLPLFYRLCSAGCRRGAW